MKLKIRKAILGIIIAMAAMLILFRYKEYKINSKIKEIGDSASIILLKDQNTLHNNIEVGLIDRLNKSSNYNKANFIKGCFEIEKGNNKEAIESLKVVIDGLNEEKSNNINDYLKVYATSMLAQLYHKEGKLQEASNIIFIQYSMLDYNTYIKYENVIWNTLTIITNFADKIDGEIERLNSGNNLSKTNKINILRQIKKYYAPYNDSPVSYSSIIKMIMLFDFLSVDYIEDKTIIDIANLFSQLGEYEQSIGSMKYVLDKELEDKYEDAYVKTDAYMNLASIYLQNSQYDKAEKNIQEIDKYITFFNAEDYRDVEILANVIKGEIYLKKDEIKKAEDILAYSRKLLAIDKEEKYSNKKEILMLLEISLLEKQEKYYEAIEKYYEILEGQEQIHSNIKMRVLNRLKNTAEIIGDKEIYDYCEDALDSEKNKLMNVIYTQYSTSYMNYIATEKSVVNQSIKINNFNNALKIETLFSLIVLVWWQIVVKKIKKTANHDHLTKIFNRQYLDKRYKYFLKKKISFAAIMLDIDNFKKINDTYGHEVGDKVLKNVCSILGGSGYQNTEVFRYGGEEIVVLVRYKEKEDVQIVAENIRVAIENIIWKENIKVTASLGVAYSDEYGERTLGKADANLYKAKNTGKNKVVYK